MQVRESSIEVGEVVIAKDYNWECLQKVLGLNTFQFIAGVHHSIFLKCKISTTLNHFVEDKASNHDTL